MADVDLNETNGNALVVTAIIFLGLTYFSVLLRTYVRAVLTHGFQADDWLMLAAQIIFTISCSFIIVGVQAGLGHHNKALEQADEIEALKWQALATATYVLNMMFIKLSIGIFLLRLATQKRYKYIIWGSLVVIAIWSTVLFFWDIFQCHPVAAQWDATIPDFKCVSSEAVVAAAYALSIMTIVTDWLYALLPIPMIWKVKMTVQAKITVSVVLSLGIFASIATLIRLKFLADLNDVNDLLFAGTDAMIWTLVEPGVAIVASSLVTIRPLLRAWKLKGFESTDRYAYGSQRYGLRSGTGTATGTGTGKFRQNRGSMPGFGSQDIANGDVELGNKSFSATTTVTSTKGFSGATGTNKALPILPPAETITSDRNGRAKPFSRMSEGTAGAAMTKSVTVKTKIATNPLTTQSHMRTGSGGPLNSNPGPFAKPPMPPPNSTLPMPPAGLAPPNQRRNEVTSEMYIIEGERISPVR